jgi:hypothetical protein
MVNLTPDMTGLPMTVWASPRGRTRHDVRLKVHRRHGAKMDINNTAVIGVRPLPYIAAGDLKPKDQQAVFPWIHTNEQVLVDYWEGKINTAVFIQRLHKVEVPNGTTRATL